MKNHKLLVLAGCLWASSLLAQTADDYVAWGRTNLVAHNLVAANADFINALALSPTNEDANALVAVTRLLLLPTQPAGSNFLNSLGFSASGRDVYNWTSKLPKDTNGNTVLPTENTSVMIAFYRTNIMVALAASRTNLAKITDTNFKLVLTADETSIESVTVDYGDILLLQALERVAEFMGYTLNAHNFNVVISHLHDLGKTNGLTIQRVLSDYPSLLTQSSASDLTNSKSAFTNAIILYQQASDFIRNVRQPGAQRLFNLSPDETNNEALFRSELTNALLSLNQAVQLNTNKISSTIYAGAYFAGTHSLRSLMPQFNGDVYVNDTLPDYTFGGILPYEPAYKTEAMLRKMFHSYAGIYGGWVYDITFVDPNAGYFAAFVSTNGQATVVGYDIDSFENGNGQAGGVAAQFNVDQHGDWQFNSNNSIFGVSGFGSMGKDGSFWGELDFTNGDSVQLNGFQPSQQSPLGPFQNAAGNYSGTWSGTFGGHSESGTVMVVLAADGHVIFCAFNHGAENDGGLGQFDSNNHFSTTDTASGSTVSGTLNTNSFQITGTSSNQYGSANWTMSRSAKVPFDVPPVITTPPTNKVVPLGTNVTFNLVASGSPPMCYQWYDNNNVIIPSATTNTLTINNVQYGSAGTYSVTINNCAGGTNASVTLTVVPETVKPTNQIVTPTSGLQVSNASYTVTGKAGDNVAVSNVWVQLNNTGWNPATTTNQWTNWTAAVTLISGSNTVQAYAMDTSGNVSTTNTVIFDYVVSAILTVSTNGLGSLNPNYNGAPLQIGNRYSITATAGTGFAFTNWTGGTELPLSVITNGTTVQFVMVSNLMLQANFVDVTKPTLSITNLTAGQRLSNATFTVKGTASDNWQVSNVVCQINAGGWNSATNINNWTNWAAGVTLTPGTNVMQAYAVDTTGNKSATNSVSFQFVVTNQLQVQMAGRGTLSPNYSNTWLEIGRNYSMAATPGSGFMFTNWVISTNWIGGVKTNNATVQFMMQSNLTLQVSFVDVTKPTLTITAPTSGQHLTNALANVKGTASDNWGVSNVWYQLNSNAWSVATSANGWTNWSVTLTLVAGTNTVKAYAVDLGANLSTTNSVSFVSSNTFRLELGFAATQPMASNGLNFNLQVSPGLNGRIEASTNLWDWMPLTNFIGTNTTIYFRDAAATNFDQRFYRAVVP